MIQVRNAPDKTGADGQWLRSYREEGVRYHTRGGCLWNSIETRAGGKFQSTNTSYKGVVNGFKNFQSFVEWCRGCEGYYRYDTSDRPWEIDKDLLGGHYYSPTTCLFLPHSLNAAIVDRSQSEVGGVRVVPSTGKYTARHPARGHIGTFDTELKARLAFIEVKSSHIRALCVKENLNSSIIDAVENYLKTMEV